MKQEIVYPKLPERFKRDWIAALKDKEQYPKGTGCLTNYNETFCCLGVAGKMCGVPISEMKNKPSLSSDMDNSSKVPKAIIGPGNDKDVIEKLMNLNDSHKTFLPVIRFIEKNL